MNKINSNKLSVYLIKSNFEEDSKILKDDEQFNKVTIGKIGTFYYDNSVQSKPTWVKNFFSGQLNEINLFNASSKAIFLCRVKIDETTTRIFAIPFGFGKHMMNNGVYEERFGLKITLNSVDSTNLRKIDKKSLSSIPKHSIEQISQDGNASDFNINFEQDLIQSITGLSKDQQFGRTITGKDSFNLSAKINIENLHDNLNRIFKYYLSNDYKKEFGWIDFISPILDKNKIKLLNELVLKNIKEKTLDNIWLSVPEIIDWSDIAGFTFTVSNRKELMDDIFMDSFYNHFKNELLSELTVEYLKKNKVFAISSSSENIYSQWTLYQCLYAECSLESNKICLLTNGNWYEIDNNYVDTVNNEYFELIDRESIQLPDYNHENENSYNNYVASNKSGFISLDGKNINYGGGYSKIEFCDLFSNNKEIIHVKHYSGSSVLSHLFSQGSVSGELFLSDYDFRDKINKILPPSHQLINPNEMPNASEYTIVFAIISKTKKNVLNLPFFSKVKLKNTKKLLEAFGYKLTITKIQNIKIQ